MVRSSGTRSSRSCSCCISSATSWLGIAVAFLLFRLFDIVKPPPIRQLDRAMKNGTGVMLDDLLAAGYTLLVLALWKRVTG